MIPFNKPYLTGVEIQMISRAHELGQLSGDGYFTNLCSSWLEKNTGTERALLTHSCTAALEMAAILINIQPGDEIIMPSYTFVSSANAFVLRGGIPVFIDIREDTLNIDETLIEQAITKKTKAIVPVHYAGVSCEMDTIMGIAKQYNLLVIEDAAQAIMSQYKGKPLGSIGDFGCLSFHETKNIIAGEGGALLINNKEYIERAEIIREKGTNRTQFFKGGLDKYSWKDIGSSYLPGEIVAAFLFAQLEEAYLITKKRVKIWDEYKMFFSNLKSLPACRIPYIPENCTKNGHIFYLLLNDRNMRESFIVFMKAHGIQSISHYVPLHNSDGGRKFGRIGSNSMKITEDMASSIVRLPLWVGLKTEVVIEALSKWCIENPNLNPS